MSRAWRQAGVDVTGGRQYRSTAPLDYMPDPMEKYPTYGQ